MLIEMSDSRRAGVCGLQVARCVFMKRARARQGGGGEGGGDCLRMADQPQVAHSQEADSL